MYLGITTVMAFYTSLTDFLHFLFWTYQVGCSDIWVMLDKFIFKYKNNLTLYVPVEQYYIIIH